MICYLVIMALNLCGTIISQFNSNNLEGYLGL